ncbi:MAG: hypothetical protein JWO91_3877 [Acidobacteriaceae bacterium]|nr:hypothetical protein [Acidobacteriaceae bacterium]
MLEKYLNLALEFSLQGLKLRDLREGYLIGGRPSFEN